MPMPRPTPRPISVTSLPELELGLVAEVLDEADADARVEVALDTIELIMIVVDDITGDIVVATAVTFADGEGVELTLRPSLMNIAPLSKCWLLYTNSK